MKHHLRRCVDQHGNACDQSRHDLRRLADEPFAPHQWPESFRVIDVEQLQVIPAPTGCSYLALSYVWDHSDKGCFPQAKIATFPDLCKPQGLPTLGLPQTVADALFVCRQLGERYL